jgi:6-methylsalicylate decarboxylase
VSSPFPLPDAIDVHSHFLTTRYREEASAAGHGRPDGMPALPTWSAEEALGLMDEVGIRASMLSVSSPGVHFGDRDQALALARHMNETAAQVKADRPDRFGFFACLPLPDVDAALEEAAYAFDSLGADGVVAQTNHAGVYLGDDRLAPLLAELDRRGACLFLHPTSPHCTCAAGPGLRYPRPMMEFLFETTRTVIDLILSGALDRYPNLRIIVPHAGATIPALADRVASMIPLLGLGDTMDAARFFQHLKRLYYDLAGQPTPRLLPALLTLADPEKLLYGSDYPFTPRPFVGRLASQLRDSPSFDESARARIANGNALKLFPRLAT